MSPQTRSEKRILLYAPGNSEADKSLVSFLEREGFSLDLVSDLSILGEYVTQRWYALILLRIHWPDQVDALFDFLQEFPTDLHKLVYLDSPMYSNAPNEILARQSQLSALNAFHLRDTSDFVQDRLLDGINDYLDYRQNAALRILSSPNGQIHLHGLPGMLDPAISDVLSGYRVTELRDLFGRHFTDVEALELDRVVWVQNGGLGMFSRIYIKAKDGFEPRFILLRTIQPGQAVHFPGDQHGLIQRRPPSQTSHFALAEYSLDGQPDYNNLKSLDELANESAFEPALSVLDKFFQDPLSAGKKNGRSLSAAEDLTPQFQQMFSLDEPSKLVENVQATLQQLQELGQRLSFTLHYSDKSLSIQLADEHMQEPDPLPALKRFLNTPLIGPRERHPNPLRLQNLLVDQYNGQIWLTCGEVNFATPPGWSSLQMEADLCLHPRNSIPLLAQLQLQKGLYTKGLDVKIESLPPFLHGPAEVISTLRRHANLDEKLHHLYLAGLIYYAMALLQKPFSLEMGGRYGETVIAAAFALPRMLKAFSESEYVRESAWEIGRGLITRDSDSEKLYLDGRPFKVPGNTQKRLLEFCLRQGNGKLIKYNQIAREVLRYSEASKENIHKVKSRLAQTLTNLYPDGVYLEKNDDDGYIFHNPPLRKDAT